MNKVALTVAIVAAFVAATYAGPVNRPQMIDWTAVGDQVDAIESYMRNTVDNVKDMAMNDNAMVGEMMAAKCDAHIDMANLIFGRVRMAVKQQTLTEGQARGMMGELMGVMGKLKGAMEMDMHMLTPAVAVQINRMMTDSFNHMNMMGDELCTMLRMAGVQMVNWEHVADKVNAIEAHMRSTMDNVVNMAMNDNAMVGEMMAAKCDAHMNMANLVFGRVRMAVKQQTLTEGQARGMMGELMGVMGQLKGAMEREMNMLTPAVAVQIRMMMTDSFTEMNRMGDELCTMLRMTGVQMVNWEHVAAKVSGIGNMVRDSAEDIRMIANNDNAMVGSSIGAKIDNAMMMARTIMEQANAAVAAQTMTEDQARGWMGQLRGGMGQLMALMKDDLNMLTIPAAVQIRQRFGLCFDTLDTMSEELYRMLRM